MKLDAKQCELVQLMQKFIDEPMAPQIVTDYDHDKKCFLSDNADGKFTASGLSSKIIFRGAILCMKEEKKKPRNYIQIGSMHVEIG